MTTFNAGTIIVEWRADLKQFKADARTAEDLSKKSGINAGKKYNTAFKKGIDGKAIGTEFQKNISKGFDGKEAGSQDGKSYARGFKSKTKNLLSAGGSKGSGFLKNGAKIVGGKFNFFDNGLAGIAKSAVDAASEISSLSSQIGLTAEQYQELEIATNKLGANSGTVFDAFKEMNDLVSEFVASNGTLKEGSDLFKFLEIDQALIDGTLTSSEKIFEKIVDGLKSIENPFERAEAAAIAFGEEGGRNLASTISVGIVEIDKLREAASDSGQVLANETATAAQEVNLKLDDLARTMKTKTTAALVEMAPTIGAISDEIIELIPFLLKATEAGLSMANSYGKAFGALKEVARNIGIGDTGPKPLANTIEGLEEQKQKLELLKKAVEQEQRTGFLPGGLSGQIFGDIAVEGAGNDFFGVGAFQKARRSQILFGIEYQTVLNNIDAKKKSILDSEKASANIGRELANDADQKPRSVNGQRSFKTNIASTGTRKLPSDQDSADIKRLTDFKRRRRIEQAALAEKLSQAQKFFEDSRTPMEKYEARLQSLALFEQDLFFANAAGGAETFSRLRVQKINNLATETGDYEGALTKLVEANKQGLISTTDFGTGFQQLTDKIEPAGAALERLASLAESGGLDETSTTAARNNIKDSADYLDDIVDTKIQVLQKQEEELANELRLAQMRQTLGSEDGVQALKRRLALTKEEIRLLEQGVDPENSEEKANIFVDAEEAARLQGEFKNAFKGAFRAALDGNFESFLSNKLKNAASQMFDRALDNLLDVLIKNLANLFPNGGGGIASFFAGFFADGGVIGQGQFGLVGENGPELVSAGSAPIRITPLDGGLRGFGTNGLENPGTNQSAASNVVMNISGVKDLGAFVKSQGTIEADMAATMRRAQADF